MILRRCDVEQYVPASAAEISAIGPYSCLHTLIKDERGCTCVGSYVMAHEPCDAASRRVSKLKFYSGAHLGSVPFESDRDL